jgi:hypothetical protein
MIDRLKYNFDKAQALKEHPAIASDEWRQLEKEPPEERTVLAFIAHLWARIIGWPFIISAEIEASVVASKKCRLEENHVTGRRNHH